MSLQDQLLKAGLTSKNKVQQARTAKRKQRKQSPSEADGQLSESELAQQNAAKTRAEKLEKDRALNQQRENERLQREQLARIRQIIEQHALSPEDLTGTTTPGESGESDVYRFNVDNTVREIAVSARIRKQIVDGWLAIVRKEPYGPGGSVYFLVPRAIAEEIAQHDSRLIVLLHDTAQQNDSSGDEEDPYAGYEIPDDLMW